MADKLRTLQNLEAQQTRYIGTGHADTTKHEFLSNIVRDSYASYVGHAPLLGYMALGMGESREKVRAMMLERMVRGVGSPPEVCLNDIVSWERAERGCLECANCWNYRRRNDWLIERLSERMKEVDSTVRDFSNGIG
ncbi:splicing factor 3B subunit 10-domain-containing protein [Aspergillus crustosus]